MKVFLIGLLMGFCDLIPGVSGASIAYLFGIYPKIVQSIHQMDLQLLKNLTLFRFRKVNRQVDFRFIFALLGGILLSIFTLCHLTRIVMMTSVGFCCVIGLFLGFIGALSVQQLKQMQDYFSFHARFSLIGFISFYVLQFLLEHIQIVSIDAGIISPVWLVSGLLTSMASLLPGISGALVLFLLGLYQPLINALCFVPFGHIPSIFVVLNFAIGVVGGLLLCGKILYRFIQRYEVRTKLFLTGFTFAAVISLTRYFYIFKGMLLGISLLFVLIGIMLATVINKWRYEPA